MLNIKTIKNFLERNEILIIILCLTVFLRVPSLFEPYWYGDEAIYLTIGQAMRAGVPLYSEIHDNKPPLLYVVAALAGGNQFWFKMIALIWTTGTVGIFYKLAEKIIPEGKWKQIATAVFAWLVCWPKLEGNIANAELFFLLPTITAAYLLWNAKTEKTIWVAGIALGAGALFKMPAMLEAGVWPVWWLLSKDKNWVKKTMILTITVIGVIGASVAYYAVAGAGKEYFTAAWAQNLPYLSSWKSPSGASGIFTLTGRAVAAVILAGTILMLTKQTDKRARIVGVWGVIAVFAGLLSGRPYPHYLLQGAGVLAISTVLIIGGKGREKLVSGLVVGSFLLATQVFKFWGYETIGYYKNFAGWVSGQKSREEYFAWFNPRVNESYKIAEIITTGTNPSERIFVWGDEPMIYAISKRLPVGKYTVKYHILDFKAQEETSQLLATNLPRYIINYGNETELPGLAELMSAYYFRQDQVGQAVIYRRIISEQP